MVRFIKNDLHIDFMGAQRWAILGSVLFIAIGIMSLIVKGGPHYGVDFTGGTLVQIKFHKTMDIDDIRESLSALKLGELLIQHYGPKEENEVIMRMSTISSSIEGIEKDIVDIFARKFGPDSFDIRRVEMVGPKVGKDLRRNGAWAITLTCLAILVYTWWRFEFVWGVGAIVALVHDVLVTIGALSLTNREISLTVIAALLTIIGYSINDTIVIFDRVRENIKLEHGKNLRDIFNESINQTLSRTIFTNLTTLFVVFSLYAFGGEVINDFAFSLLVGCIAGTYSTMYIASPVSLFFHNLLFAPKKRGMKSMVPDSGAMAGVNEGGKLHKHPKKHGKRQCKARNA